MPSPCVPHLAIVVLAAGRSQRLGRPKPLVRLRGRTLLARTLDALVPGAGPVRVIIPPRSPRLRQMARAHQALAMVNPERHRGLSTSIRRALAASRASAAVLFVPVDLPWLERRDLARLIHRWQGSPRRVIARKIDATRGGTPLILPRRLFGRAGALRGDQGLKTLLPPLGAGEQRLLDLPSAVEDIDTSIDLTRARRCWRRHGPP